MSDLKIRFYFCYREKIEISKETFQRLIKRFGINNVSIDFRKEKNELHLIFHSNIYLTVK